MVISLAQNMSYIVTGVTLATIEELVGNPQVSVSIVGTLRVRVWGLSASAFAALTDDKVQEFTGSLHVQDTAAAFFEVFDADDINDIAQYRAENPEAPVLSFSAD